MSILFRCPCGRSMVVESDRAGAQVMCPNCRRTLKVPSGKDRGVELASAPAATKTRTSRTCPRCRKEVPVDTQVCPHCKTPLGQGAAAAPAAPAAPAATARNALADAVRSASGGAPRPAAPARAAAATPSAAAADEEEHVIIYGGSRASWFTMLSAGAKAGVIGGSVAFVLLLVIIGYFLYTSWHAGQVVEARNVAQRALITEGRKFENQGKFQEAYELCYSARNMLAFLRSTGQPSDIAMADSIQTRISALHYLVADPKFHIGESVYWKPKNQAELDQAIAHLRETYPTYRNAVLAWCDAVAAAIQTGRANPNQAAFEDKVTQMMDAYVKFVGQTDEQQRAQYTFQTLIEAIRAVTAANRHWGNPDRNQDLMNATGYLDALRERASTPGYPDAIWER